MSFLIDLECGACGEHHAADELQNLCPACGKPLLARYDLTSAGQTLTKEALELREPTHVPCFVPHVGTIYPTFTS